MAHTPIPDWLTIDAYLAGTLSPADRATFEHWCRANPDEWAALQRVDRAILVGSGTHDRDTVGAFIDRVERARAVQDLARNTARNTAQNAARNTALRASSLYSTRSDAARAHPPSTVSQWVPGRTAGRLRIQTLQPWLWAIATVVAVVLALQFGTHNDAGTTRTYATQSGQQATLTLVDGTRVTLSPLTTLRLDHFGATSRTVTVDGEAYFEVARSGEAPFIARNGAAIVRVLGTSFLMRSSSDKRQAHVAVAEGKVSVEPTVTSRAGVPLSPGDVGDVRDSTVRVSTSDDVVGGVESRHGNFVFRRTPLSSVLETLTRWYGYQFRCADSALVRRSMTIWLSQRSSADAISALEDQLGIKSTMVGDTIMLASPVPRRESNIPRKRVYEVWTPNHEIGR